MPVARHRGRARRPGGRDRRDRRRERPLRAHQRRARQGRRHRHRHARPRRRSTAPSRSRASTSPSRALPRRCSTRSSARGLIQAARRCSRSTCPSRSSRRAGQLASGACSTRSWPESDWSARPRRMLTACARCTARTSSACPTRTSRSSSGRRGRSTRRRSRARVLRDGRGGYCFELNTLLAALLRAVGFVVTHHQAVVGGEGPTNHMALLVRLDGERWIADAGLGEGFLEPLPLREGRYDRGPFTLHAEPRAGRHVVDGPARVELVQRLPDAGADLHARRLRAAPPAAGDRPRVAVRAARWWSSSRARTGS